ncbi:MAG TPA: hypothetical protein VHZ51_06465 [Ktedonobacteraceae bacterium]|jgi:polyhydroxyalkanoate synthesis regulator phasin|nr:hypothetical protein [Ktedonobacteraceae bacterium]
MSKTKNFLVIVGGSVLLVACMLFGAFYAGPLITSAHTAQNSATTPTTKAKKTPQNSPYCELYNQALAKSLNVSTSTLSQDRTNALNSVLAQMVKDGKLTQNQVNTIEQNRAKHQQVCGSFRAGTWELHQVRNYLRAHRADLVAPLASGLHLQSSQLTAQLKSGKSLDAIAKSQKVTHAQLVSLLTTTLTNEVNKGVSSGALNKDQASTFQQVVKNHPRLLNLAAAHHWHVK